MFIERSRIKIIVECESDKSCDFYIIDNVDNLQELRSLVIRQEKPILVKRVRSKYKNIIVKEDLQGVLVYFNNYLKVRDVSCYYTLLTKEEFDCVVEKQCNTCRKHDGWYCDYHPDENDICITKEEVVTFSLIKWIKTIFKKSNKN